ncbi:hypothetical protein [Micromonospora sp. WMMD812]|uniref:hypothetical protein n=1 Tax=Micromonospora sp. WMMD812 TaxID=3015152 RepID=UPI00248BBF57|nr:hypothetical protein [Micromonospora sp. WMMD812]WBB70588.1 hypothetical protein O7603_15040 [Micromonospora sp. WMMD812]
MSMKVRRRWFDEGAAALRDFADLRPGQVEVPDGSWYCCPCCCWAFGPDALDSRELTIEHVPADSVGGRGTLLTCRSCNNKAGEQLDVYAANRENLIQFLDTKATSKRYRVVMDADGIPLRGSAWFENGTLRIQGVDKQNHPLVRDQHIAKLNEFVDSETTSPPLTFKVRVEKISDARANLSWIRSAYLVAFCAFGLPYIINPIMAELRDCLDKPGTCTTPIRIARDADAPKGRRVLALMKDPVESIVVGLDAYNVLLPSPKNMMRLSALAKVIDDHTREDGLRMLGQTIQWPRYPEYRYR